MDEGYHDPFHLLVACIISLRTKDAVTREASRRLFEIVSRPADLAQTNPDRIAELIYPAGFYRTKSKQLNQIGRILVEEYHGKVPSTREDLMALPGVGRKTANLVLGLGFDTPAICVDTHVHRISQRLGWVRTKTPAETEAALELLLPRCWWIPVNDILVTFGQRVCLPRNPRCAQCPIQSDCPKIGVDPNRESETPT